MPELKTAPVTEPLTAQIAAPCAMPDPADPDFNDCRRAAAYAGCYVAQKRDQRGLYYLLFRRDSRRVDERGIYLGKRRNLTAFKYFVWRICGYRPEAAL